MNKPNVFSVIASQFMKQNLDRAAIPLQRSKVIYYGIDTEKFTLLSKADTVDKVFLQVSSFREKKGHRYTLEAFQRFLGQNPDKQAKLILAGGGEGMNSIQNYAEKLGLSHLVEFPGWVTHDQAQALMQQADVFVHHSITPNSGDEEGIPNALIEAMSMELPILSTQHAGIPELVEDGVHGYLVPERDVEAYARRMVDIYDWPRQPQNREKVKAQFDLEVHARELAAWYEFALSAVSKKV
jgi:glycosyltransferase involved in cell wall biosynthesis